MAGYPFNISEKLQKSQWKLMENTENFILSFEMKPSR